MNDGKLVAFEGLDGSGKSTQLALLAAALGESRAVLSTREPTDGPWGRRIRAMARSGRRVAPEEELRWFVEDRREHVEQVIRPALAQGRWVLTDRYFLSTVAYQGARGLAWPELLDEAEARFPLPDLVVLLEIPPEDGLARVQGRGAPLETVFEVEAFQRSVAEIFAAIERPYIERVPAGGAPEDVHAAVLARVEQRLGL